MSAGAMGTLILGVMSRVALGHTGRALQLSRGMTTAVVLVTIAGGLRVATALGGVPAATGWLISGIVWILAYGIFVVAYLPILTAPRVDGRPG